MNRMPRYAYEAGCEVVICRHHRNSYDKAFEVAGARLVEVGLLDRALGVGVREVEPEEIEAVIGPRTVALAYVAMQGVGPDLAVFAQVAHRRRVPVIVDAANQVPPLENLRRFIAEGADLVAMSGGKAFRGPQSSGFLCGRRDLVASALLQTARHGRVTFRVGAAQGVRAPTAERRAAARFRARLQGRQGGDRRVRWRPWTHS